MLGTSQMKSTGLWICWLLRYVVDAHVYSSNALCYVRIIEYSFHICFAFMEPETPQIWISNLRSSCYMIMQQTPIFAPLRWIMMCLVIIDMLFVWHQHSYNRLQNEGWSLKKYMYISSFFIAWMIPLQTLDLPQGKEHVYILD